MGRKHTQAAIDGRLAAIHDALCRGAWNRQSACQLARKHGVNARQIRSDVALVRNQMVADTPAAPEARAQLIEEVRRMRYVAREKGESGIAMRLIKLEAQVLGLMPDPGHAEVVLHLGDMSPERISTVAREAVIEAIGLLGPGVVRQLVDGDSLGSSMPIIETVAVSSGDR